MNDKLLSFIDYEGLHILAVIVLVCLTILFVGLISLIVLFFLDKNQSKHSILRNYPVIGRFRFLFEFLGHFFRQYFFAADREELPFNRSTRTWVYQAAKNVDTTVAFGSTNCITTPGSVIFVNDAFPTLKIDSEAPKKLIIGPYCKYPYEAPSYFNISGMSYGALSKPAVLALSKGAKLANCWLNTGEGGISPYHLSAGCDLVGQIGTAKYGYRNLKGDFDKEKIINLAKNNNIKMFELKLSQGAKPGKGGMLPAIKVTKEIAEIRGIEIGKDSISPNRHPEHKTVADILETINFIRDLTQKPVGIKFVLGSTRWLIDLLNEIEKKGIEYAPDFITLDSADGGTGAAPLALIDNVGLPIKESLPLVVDLLEKYSLKDRIKVIASGKLITPADVAWALCVGADFIVSARGFMFALGCIQALQCNKNTCPTGITTHNKRLQNGLVPEEKSARVANYVNNMVDEVWQIAHACGVKEPRQLKRHHCRIVLPNGKSVSLDNY